MRYLLLLLVALVATSFPSKALAQGGGTYVLGPEDVVSVVVLNQPAFSGEYLVPSSGVIMLPVVGRINVSGLSLDEFSTRVTKGFAKRLKRPEVIVALKVARPQKVSVFGDVRSPAIYDVRAGWRITQALSAAGGIAPGMTAADITVVLDRPGAPRRTIPLTQVLRDASANDIELRAGDSIRFEAVPMITVNVAGRVKSPGQFKLKQSEAGVLGVLTLAGGSVDDADLTKARILHADGTEETIDLSPALEKGESTKLPKLSEGDTLVLTRSDERFVILGYVQRPGDYALPTGRPTKLADAVALASGGTANSRLSRVGLMRTREGVTERKVYDLGKYLAKGDTTQNPTIYPGDVLYVPESNRVDVLRTLGAVTGVVLLFSRLFGQ